MDDCKHDGEKDTEVTKAGVYRICKVCGKRLYELAVIEKLDGVKDGSSD